MDTSSDEEESCRAPSPPVPMRPRGRPKGAVSKRREKSDRVPSPPVPKRPRGRPKGAVSKRREESGRVPSPPVPKRPRGRPKGAVSKSRKNLTRPRMSLRSARPSFFCRPPTLPPTTVNFGVGISIKVPAQSVDFQLDDPEYAELIRLKSLEQGTSQNVNRPSTSVVDQDSLPAGWMDLDTTELSFNLEVSSTSSSSHSSEQELHVYEPSTSTPMKTHNIASPGRRIDPDNSALSSTASSDLELQSFSPDLNQPSTSTFCTCMAPEPSGYRRIINTVRRKNKPPKDVYNYRPIAGGPLIRSTGEVPSNTDDAALFIFKKNCTCKNVQEKEAPHSCGDTPNCFRRFLTKKKKYAAPTIHYRYVGNVTDDTMSPRSFKDVLS